MMDIEQAKELQELREEAKSAWAIMIESAEGYRAALMQAHDWEQREAVLAGHLDAIDDASPDDLRFLIQELLERLFSDDTNESEAG